MAQPRLSIERGPIDKNLEAPLVENADFGHYRKLSNGLAIDVACDMADTLVPDDSLNIVPALALQLRMDCRPTHLCTPEPQGRARSRVLAPLGNVGSIPLDKAIFTDGVTIEASNPVGTIADDARRGGPILIGIENIASVQQIRLRVTSHDHSSYRYLLCDPFRIARFRTRRLGVILRVARAQQSVPETVSVISNVPKHMN